MRHARLTIVALLLGIGLLGAYFCARGQGPRLPWPPAPVAPPANFEESEPPPDRSAGKLPVPRPITPPDLLPNLPVIPTRFEQPSGPDLPPPAPIQVEVSPPPLPVSASTDAKKNIMTEPKPAPSPLPAKTVAEDKGNDLIVLPPGLTPLPVAVQPNPEPMAPMQPLPKPASRPRPPVFANERVTVPEANPQASPPKLKAFQLVNPVRRSNPSSFAAPLDSPPPLDRAVVQAQPVAQSKPLTENSTFSGNATPQVTVDKRGPAAARAGETMQFAIMVRNVGSTTATQVRIEDEIPVGARVVGGDPQPVLQNDRATWIISALAPGGERQLKIELVAANGGELMSSTSALVGTTAALRTYVSQDNGSRPEIRPSKDGLSLVVKAPANVTVGTQVVFEVVVTNHGKDELTKVVLHGILPPGLTHPFGREIEADVSNIAAGATKVFKMPVNAAEAGRQIVDVKITTQNGVEATGQGTVEVTPRTRSVGARMSSARGLAH